VEESHRLNNRLVLLTLSVSGAPFLGLLGTVIGIMITFASIAMAGDVNVNTIAPGVAAALTATVSGLVVAIPVLFGYNFLVSRIRELTTGMEVFANELLGKLALRAALAPAVAEAQAPARAVA
jgi:biopolymer transport protein ExbB